MRFSAAYRRLVREVSGSVTRDEPLAPHTTFRIGGPAALYVECLTIQDVSAVIRVCRDEDVSWTCVGGGSNLLVSDSGYDGAVIRLRGDLASTNWEGTRLEAGAGASLAGVVRAARERGLHGLECCVGVPGTVGGAVVMNAGSRDEWLGSVVDAVRMVGVDGEESVVSGDRVDWSYRTSGLAARGVVVGATLALVQGDADEIARRMDESLSARRRSQPAGLPNAGSVFVNPPGDSAGRLIESAGLKGTTVGGACVSNVHANFIVNTGDATAQDVATLIAIVRNAVEKEHDVILETEIRFLGAFRSA